MDNQFAATLAWLGVLSVPVGDLIHVAVAARDVYVALEMPDERGTMASGAEALPKLESALKNAGMLK